MGTVTRITRARFSVGLFVHHRLFDYRGVIVDVDPSFQGTEEWYATVARSRPPKDKPWYHVLVHDAVHTTYFAERNLEPDTSRDPITHPMLGHLFSRFENGRYVKDQRSNLRKRRRTRFPTPTLKRKGTRPQTFNSEKSI